MDKHSRLIKKQRLGKGAVRLLNRTLPLVLIQAAGTALFLSYADPKEIAFRTDLIHTMLERIFAMLLLSVVGSLLYDLLEKRDQRKS